MKQKLNGIEWDWTSLRSRRLLYWKSGVGKFIKRCMNKRLRQDGKQEIRNE